MNRRHLLASIASSVGAIPLLTSDANAEELRPVLPGSIKVALNKEFTIGIKSTPIALETTKISLVSIGTGKLNVDDKGRMTAKIRAAITQYAKVDYWISLAALDKHYALLGVATHKEAIQYIRLGVMPTLLPELEFDFGMSKGFGSVARLAVAISDRDVPKTG